MQVATLLAVLSLLGSNQNAASDWSSDPVWHDGLVEKATYSATRVIYGKPRVYEAVFFTNKEQHDTRTLTKSTGGGDTIEVWKFNQVEVIPTPNYDYKFVTTAHHTVQHLILTRLDVSSQEFCGTSFKQYLLTPAASAMGPRSSNLSWDYWSFSYMPEEGREQKIIAAPDSRPVVPFNSLPLWLRGFNFAGRGGVMVYVLLDQKTNRAAASTPIPAQAQFAGEEDGSYKIEVVTAQVTSADGRILRESRLLATFWMSNDPAKRHVMTKFAAADGSQTYELKSVERVNYWTRSE